VKKQTKKTIMSLAIIITFALSSIAFVFSGFLSPQQQTDQMKPLTSFVVNGDINPQLEQRYLSAGYTFLKFYYNSTIDPSLVAFVEQAPDTFKTNDGQIQLIVQKYEANENYASIFNINGQNDYYNITHDEVFQGICTQLLATSYECALINLNLSG
jgi:hypothetical protein